MLHIVFNESEVELLKEVIGLDETLQGDIFHIRDDYAVGPLTDLQTDEGWQARKDWWMHIISFSHYTDKEIHHFDDRETIKQVIKQLEEHPQLELWIWMGQNQHDVCGYFRILNDFRQFQGRIMVLYMNNLPFINDKGQLFYPSWLNEIPPREFVKAKKLARPITLSEFEVDPDEWERLCTENAPVRILEGGKKIVAKEETFYDNEIIRNLSGEWQKAWRLVGNTLHRMKIKTGDVFIEWRIKQLIAEGKIEITGDIEKGWKEFDVRLPSKKTEDASYSQSDAN
ncbi:MAG: DUF1835 domain-containing protein [Chitinophagaceae bacterium]|nr:DUF1835 domain-containing protein [Chitinophagaceae bacterium]MCB9055682.1 DUF1835 domain-containing protein [Chitinophagales bacterium]